MDFNYYFTNAQSDLLYILILAQMQGKIQGQF